MSILFSKYYIDKCKQAWYNETNTIPNHITTEEFAMKKIGSFIINSFILFWSYFLTSFLCLMVLQTFMRLIFDADSKWEFAWKTLVMYAFMLITCMVHLKVTASTHKTKYLTYMSGKEWSLKETLAYVLKNTDFWLNTIGFAIWPIIIPKFFGAIQWLYVSATFLETFPRAILAIPTVSLPIVILSLAGWVLTLRTWCMGRLHK